MKNTFVHKLYPTEEAIIIKNKSFIKTDSPDSFNWRFVNSGIIRSSSTLDSGFYPTPKMWNDLGYSEGYVSIFQQIHKAEEMRQRMDVEINIAENMLEDF